MKYKIMSKFIVISFCSAQFVGAILFVLGIVKFTDGPLTWDSHYIYAIHVLIGYYLVRSRNIQDIIDEFDTNKSDTTTRNDSQDDQTTPPVKLEYESRTNESR